MPNLTTSANVDSLMGSADYATFRTLLSLTALATTTPGANVANFLAAPSSANLASAVTGETGTGALVFGTGPTLDGPTLLNTTTAATIAATTVTATTFNVTSSFTLAENVSIALDPVLSADGKYTGVSIAGTAGTTLAFGDLVYLAVADSRWELTDADSVTTCGAVWTGMCVLAAAADGDPTVILLVGNVRADANFPTLTIGAPVYASTTPGDIQVAQPSGADDVIQVVGFALTADSIYFNPSPDYMTHT